MKEKQVVFIKTILWNPECDKNMVCTGLCNELESKWELQK